MPWKEIGAMSQRKEFVGLANRKGANVSELCRRFEISRKNGYKWMNRAKAGGADWERDRSRRPRRMPRRTEEAVERAVLAVRNEASAWGGRKIRAILERKGGVKPPAASTITAILRRHGRIAPEESKKRGPMTRFERSEPNALWQMDFKGAFPAIARSIHTLTILDDRSRYSVCVAACADEREETVRRVLEAVFRRCGLPARLLMDNGACWKAADSKYTRLTAWLVRLGVGLSHGRPHHPQTQGKNERFNRTLKAEAITGRLYVGLDDCQTGFDRFRHRYNHERPHEALDMAVPASRCRISPIPFPESLPPILYLEGDLVRTVAPAGFVSIGKERYHVGRAFSGEPVGLRATEVDGVLATYYCNRQVAVVDRRAGTCRQC